MAPDSVFDQFGTSFDAQDLHDPILVIRNRSGRHVQNAPDFSHQLAFGHQLQYFPLAAGEALVFVN